MCLFKRHGRPKAFGRCCLKRPGFTWLVPMGWIPCGWFHFVGSTSLVPLLLVPLGYFHFVGSTLLVPLTSFHFVGWTWLAPSWLVHTLLVPICWCHYVAYTLLVPFRCFHLLASTVLVLQLTLESTFEIHLCKSNFIHFSNSPLIHS